jgi:hypothetical protein
MTVSILDRMTLICGAIGDVFLRNRLVLVSPANAHSVAGTVLTANTALSSMDSTAYCLRVSLNPYHRFMLTPTY